MCGISVLIKSPADSMAADTIRAMVRLSRHRGPDDEGVVFLAPDGRAIADQPVPSWQVALGHSRLAIIDLSPLGHQPMVYGGSLWLVFNGEIYNYLELRGELRALGFAFSTQSDSEVILAAYAAWGEAAFARLRGMWGLALVDTARQRVLFSRDRLGIKPLYLVRTRAGLAAASEIKQFSALEGFSFAANEVALREYLQTGYEDPDRTMFLGVNPLPPGTWMAWDLARGEAGEPQRFWFPERVAATCRDPREAAGRLRAALQDAVSLHLRSDVPVGISLSGGLDSSTIAAVLAHDLGRPDVHTFTCVFPGYARDEGDVARLGRAALSGPATFVSPAASEFRDDLRAFTWAHDEPVGGLSVFAAYRLAKAMRNAGVIVTLSGQGGDEALGGYWQSYWFYLRNLLAGGRLLESSGHLVGALLPGGNRRLWTDAPEFVRRLWSRTRVGFEFVQPAAGFHGRRVLVEAGQVPPAHWRVYELQRLFLPRLLKWEDRNSMASGVEGRYPFLDHLFLETALSLHASTGYSRGWTKHSLRLAMRGTLPESIRVRRDKCGYEVPEAQWLHADLRPDIQRWLREDRPLWAHVDRRSVVGLTDRFWRRRQPETSVASQTLFRLLACDHWLERFGVRWS